MHVKPLNFSGNPTIGLYGFATDRFVILGPEVPEEIREDIERILQVPVLTTTIIGTSLVGAFLSGTEEKLLVPSIIDKKELEKLHTLPCDVFVLKTKLTCLGNNILIGKKAVLIHPEFPESIRKEIETFLGKPTQYFTYEHIEAVGSIAVINGNKGLFASILPDEELVALEKLLGVEITTGTVNKGNPFVRSGIIANKHGFVIGSLSGGPEITNADEALGFLQ
ncbi:MAG: translation initiation factor IF-6 [Candidatus Woesearchaeota archaeon]|nr:MAG: translation initiation factor IF-6 [Candidatus Woesearchaeota archaeon]